MFLKIYIKHPGCWSEVLSNFPHISGELLSQNVKKGVVEGFIAFKVLDKNFKGELFSLVNNIKTHRIIKSVKFIRTLENGNINIIKVSAGIKDSISNLVNNLEIPIFKEFFFGGHELWYILDSEKNFMEIKRIFNKISLIRGMEILPGEDYFKLFSFISDDLKFDYINLLNTAYYNNYFGYPRGIDIDGLAHKFNTSKSNISRKMRIIEKEITEYYLNKTQLASIK